MLFPSNKNRTQVSPVLGATRTPEHEVELNGTFENHLADATKSSSLTERQQALDKAIEAYESAPNNAFLGMFGI